MNTDPRACAAVDALRSGLVNRFVARHITYGRDREIRQLESVIRDHRDGSCQVVIGRYGVGKSHLCEVMDERLQDAGYAVARLELGSSHERAENPYGVLESVRRNIALRLDGVQFRGDTDLAFLLMASKEPSWGPDYCLTAHKRFPGRKNLLRRLAAMREGQAVPYTSYGYSWAQPEPTAFDKIPNTMTAANLAVASINRVAHKLNAIGIKGIVLLLDEAERSTWAASSYREDRARHMMLGLALASANRDTSHLKHYQNSHGYAYRPLAPSLIHSIFWFTYSWGLAELITSLTKTAPLHLQALGEDALAKVEEKIRRLYSDAYRRDVELSPAALATVRSTKRNEDTRSMVRSLVAALDHARLADHL